MWELDCEEGWMLKNWCFWTVVLEKTLESPLDCKELQPVHSEGDQPWDFFGRNDVKAPETPVLWPPEVKSWLIGKDSDAGRDWGQEEKGTRGWDGWMASQTRWTWVWVNSGSWWWNREAWRAAIHGVAKSRTWLSDWTELTDTLIIYTYYFYYLHWLLFPIFILKFLPLLDSMYKVSQTLSQSYRCISELRNQWTHTYNLIKWSKRWKGRLFPGSSSVAWTRSFSSGFLTSACT